MNEDRLRTLLRDTPVPGSADAEERGLRLVEQAHAERHRPRRGPAPRIAIALATAVGLAALLLSPAGAEVRDWIDEAVSRDGESHAALTSIPGGGTLLVTADSGAWVVHEDGSRRLLGKYEEATWSPNGLYVGVAEGNRLTAVEPDGDPRWSLTRPAEIEGVRWSPSPGFRIAYLAGTHLRVVAGDGTEDTLLAPRVAPLPPAWRPEPGPRHVLAHFTPTGAIGVLNTDTRRLLFRVPPTGSKPLGLEWSTDGQRLLAAFTDGARLYDRRGRRVGTVRGRITEAAFRPGGHEEVAVLVQRPSRTRPTSEVVLASPETTTKRLGPLFSVPGTLTDLEWSPGGDRILVGWRDADSWLFIPRGEGRVRSIGNVSAEFAPGASAGAFPRVAGWCCPPQP